MTLYVRFLAGIENFSKRFSPPNPSTDLSPVAVPFESKMNESWSDELGFLFVMYSPQALLPPLLSFCMRLSRLFKSELMCIGMESVWLQLLTFYLSASVHVSLLADFRYSVAEASRQRLSVLSQSLGGTPRRSDCFYCVTQSHLLHVSG